MFKLILILLLVFLLVRTIVSGFWAFFQGATEEPRIKNHERRREGEVTIEDKPKFNKKIGKDDGQYIDYEEVK